MSNKSSNIIRVVGYFQEKYGKTNIVVKDHWEEDHNAIGLADKTNRYLIYISTLNDKDGIYFAALENPPEDDSFPYAEGGEYDNLNLEQLELILVNHLKL